MLVRGALLNSFLKIGTRIPHQSLPRVRRMSSECSKKILITRKIAQQAVDIVKQTGWIVDVWDNDEPIPRDELLQRVPGINGLYCLLTEKVDQELLETAGPQLEVVSTMSVGYDHINTREIKNRDILLGNTPDVLTSATAELTVGLLLATSRRLMEAAQEAKSGGWGPWQPFWMCGSGLDGSTVGIFGFGRIGQAVAKRLAPFGVSKFLYSGTSPKPEAADVGAEYVSFNTLLTESDFVIACCALNAETKEIFNADSFKKMKETAIFINTSRGGVVQQVDLHNALISGNIKAAGLDVTSPEPLPTSHPLFQLNNCVILPHIASAEEHTRIGMSVLAAKNLVTGLRKEKMPAQVLL